MHRKVLLVYPGSKSMGFTNPLGLLYVAQALLKMDIEVSIHHMGIDSIKKLKLDDYLFVGISMLTGEMISDGLRVAKLIKAHNSRIPIVLGGVHPSLLPEESLRNELVDIVVIGEGDRTVQELTACLLGEGGDLSGIKGIGYKDADKQIIINPPREFMNMDELEFDIPYELIGVDYSGPVMMPVHTSRGCPYRCGFCYNPALNKRKYRHKSAERVIAEMEYLKEKYNAKSFCFAYEDEFFIDINRAYRIFRHIIDKGWKIKWTAFCRFNTFVRAYEKFGEDFIDALKRSGCYYLSFGAESGSQRLLDEIIQKDIKTEQVLKTVEILKKAGIQHRVSFMCCFPTETREDLNAEFELIDKVSTDNSFLTLGLFTYLPFPGTRIYELVKKEYGFKPPTTLRQWGAYRRPATSWVSKEHAKLCSNLSMLSNYPFFKSFESYKAFKEFVKYSPYEDGYLDYIMAKTERWRYENRRFKFMIEPRIFNYVLKFRAFFKEYLLRKYLPKSVYNMLKKRFGKTSAING